MTLEQARQWIEWHEHLVAVGWGLREQDHRFAKKVRAMLAGQDLDK